MWLIARFGLVSTLQKPCAQDLTLLARVREDLEQLRATELPQLSPGQGSQFPSSSRITSEPLTIRCGLTCSRAIQNSAQASQSLATAPFGARQFHTSGRRSGTRTASDPEAGPTLGLFPAANEASRR